MSSPESAKIRPRLNAVKFAPPPANIAESRARLEALIGDAPMPPDIKLEPFQIGSIKAEWVSSPASDDASDRAMLYLHGGAYCRGSINTHRSLAARISLAAGVRVLLIDYRLAPESLFPAAVEDACTAYRWLLANGFEPNHLAIGGDSAGGGLSVATLIAMRDAGELLPAATVLLSPWTDLTGSGASVTERADLDPWLTSTHLFAAGKMYLGEADARNPLASPLFGDLKNLPPMLIQVGSDEIIHDDSTNLAEKAQAAGVNVELEEWPEMWHVWQAFAPLLPEALTALENIGKYLRKELGLPVVQKV